MKINFRLLMLIIAAAVGIIIIGNWIFGVSFKNYLLEQETDQIETNIQNISATMNATMLKYKAIADDWGYWDETYRFIENNNPEYINLNLGRDSISNINVSFMIFLNEKYEMIHKFFYDFEKTRFVSFPDSLATSMTQLLKTEPKSMARIVDSGEDYFAVAMTETTDSLRKKPGNGFLVIGRFIDTAMISDLSKITGGRVAFRSRREAENRFSASRSNSDLYDTVCAMMINKTKTEMSVCIFPSNPDQSEPVAAIEITKTRDIYTGGMSRFQFIQILYSMLILIVILVLFLLLRVKITNPLNKLSMVLNNILIEEDRFDRLPTNKKNEFFVINSAINTMFSRIEEQQEKLKKNENRLIAAQKMAHVGNWELDTGRNIIWGSDEAFNIYGLEHKTHELSAEIVEECILPGYRRVRNDALARLISGDEKYDIVFKIKNNKTGEERYVRSKAIKKTEGNGENGENGDKIIVVGTVQDVTEYKNSEEEILYLSNHDQLTGLYNRRFYEKALVELDVAENLPITVAMGDINGLKLINDSFGHTMGDELIQKASDSILKGCRACDIVARLGGDEISIIFPKTDGEEADRIINRIINRTSKEKVGSINISISFGHETKSTMDEDMKEIIKNTEDHMYRNKLYESTSARSRTIDIIMNALYEKSDREMVHSMRVSALCEMIAKNMNFNNNDINQIRTAGLMHDIGKIGINEKILNKPGKLDKEEFKEIEKHSEIGYRILSSANEFSEMANFVLEHHEKWNGTGYPRGLGGEEISLQARIIAVADSYDAMTSDRPYGKALSEEKAILEIRQSAGSHFDPSIVAIFLKKVLKIQ